MENRSILNFYKFKDKLPEECREILLIANSDTLKKHECYIKLFTRNLKFNSEDYWCYTNDLINIVIYENKINNILFDLADDKNISIKIMN